jgi:t-SNARE complex subunit (syntaxin)
MYLERVERQYKTVNPDATQKVLRRPIAQKCRVARAQP